MAIEEVPRPVILADYIHSRLNMPFSWGENDCVTFVLGWVTIKTGRDYKSLFLPWDNEISATASIAVAGGIKPMCDKLFMSINPLMAQDGDIALIARTVYLFSGPDIVGPGPDGLVFNNRMRAKCAWSYR